MIEVKVDPVQFEAKIRAVFPNCKVEIIEDTGYFIVAHVTGDGDFSIDISQDITGWSIDTDECYHVDASLEEALDSYVKVVQGHIDFYSNEGAIRYVFPHASLGNTIRNSLSDWETRFPICNEVEHTITICFGLWFVDFDSGKTLAEAADKWQSRMQAVIDAANKPRLKLNAFKKARGIEP